ncbi:aldehyde dehydrogenase family protein [Pseudoalteromonas pernae]|uniref:aldehyde dehydrogenase family protein n=1 Tax=Pseudoalteromonas pernae TaxID=3118054 RepID=UPI0032422BD4
MIANTRELERLHQQFKTFHREQGPLSLARRKDMLSALRKALVTHQQTLVEAVSKDFGYRDEFDTVFSDILPTVDAIAYCGKHLKRWTKPQRRHPGFAHFPSKLYVNYEAKGVVGVISPWNYPINLALSPAAFAIAAGNRVVIKLSEYTPNLNAALKALLPANSDDVIAFVEGESDIAEAFSALPWDHLLFTGGTEIGRHVMRSAAQHLTPLTLELGGKSPTVVLPSAHLPSAVSQLCFGKLTNGGQICVAPDHVYVPNHMLDGFIAYVKQTVAAVTYPSTHVISTRAQQRINSLLAQACENGAEAMPLLDAQGNTRLTLLLNVDTRMDIANTEIFGPILPVYGYDDIEQVIETLKGQAKPLALYLFAQDSRQWRQVSEQVQSGTLAINDTLMQVSATDLPFGGVGESGFGQYHGKEGFITFSHARSVVQSPARWPKARLLLQRSKLLLGISKWLYLRK